MRPENERIESIVHEYSQRLLAFIRSKVDTAEDAEDILQDVFYQLVRVQEDERRPGIERMSAWLYRVARNAVMNFWRKKGEIPLSYLGEDEDEICREISSAITTEASDNPETLYLRKLVWEELEDALAELPHEQSDVFCLTVFEGLPIREISAATGIAEATLLSRKHYAVKHLRKRLHELYFALVNHQ